jgi:hypothetical protein
VIFSIFIYSYTLSELIVFLSLHYHVKFENVVINPFLKHKYLNERMNSSNCSSSSEKILRLAKQIFILLTIYMTLASLDVMY